MGIDLRLLPFDSPFFSHTILSADSRYDLWEAIEHIEGRIGRDVPDDFTSFVARGPDGELGYGQTHETSYGRPLKCVPASALVKLAPHPGVTEQAKNRAIWAYLAALDPTTRVALLWH